MKYRQGFRRHLWNWGLRGGLSGLAINFLAGAVISMILFLLIFLIPTTAHIGNDTLIAGFFLRVAAVQSVVSFLSYKLFLAVGVITGLSACFIEEKKGHSNYTVKENRKVYLKAGYWLSLICTGGLIYLVWQYDSATPGQSDLAQQLIGSASSGSLIFLSVYMLGLLRSQVEQVLRRRYSRLLEPRGSRK
jgi:hypothetical protein